MTGPERLDLRGDPEPDLAEVVEHLRRGLPLAYPTETVYGLGGPVDEASVQRIRRLKRRQPDQPLLVLVPERGAVEMLKWTSGARALADAFWPGAVTLVLEDPLRMFPTGVRSPATGAVGVRLSPHPLVRRLLQTFGGPVTSTSLNAPGEPPARSGSEAWEVAAGMDEPELLLLDVGTLPSSAPSTVVDCTGPVPVVLRAGSVPLARLRCVIPEIRDGSVS